LTAPAPGGDRAYRVKPTRWDATAEQVEAMTAQRFRCTDSACGRYARVTVQDADGERARACAHHAVKLLNGLAGARVVWDDSPGINEHEATALRLAEERSQLSRTDAAA
jgi:hypothetical protein